MRMQVKLEIGHKAACRHEPTPEGFTHDWTIFVRGSDGKDISHFVEKVIFHLHESFPKPKRAIKDPPYKLDESGYGSFELKIEVCFKTKDEPRRVNFTYDLFLPLSGLPPVTSVRTEALTFTHPTEDFMKKLVKGGGVPISSVNGVSNGVPNGHPPAPKEETKEPPTQKTTNNNDGEKTKKSKPPKSASKPAAVVGMKRSPPLHEQSNGESSSKKKKKDGLSSSKTKHFQNDSAPSQPLATEVKDLKVKFRPVPPKENTDKRKESSDSRHKDKNLHNSKGKELKSHKEHSENKKSDSSELKVKAKKKLGKAEKKKSNEKKSNEKKSNEKKSKSKKDKKGIEKVTIRRSSGDSWASAGSSSGLLSNVVAKNKALGKLLSEMTDDDDDDEALPTPFKREPSLIVAKQKEQTSTKITGLKIKENFVHNTSSDNTEKTHQASESSELVKISSTVENGVKDINENKLSKKELYDLYEQITTCEDSEFLQKVVDVIENTGLYTVAEKTFEFDLCSLEKTTLEQLQKCLNVR